MASTENCPIPEIGDALSSYIKSRAEATDIRRELHTYLESQLKTQDAPLSSITLPLPTAAPVDAPPTALTGVRRAYWKALQAHAAAQAKYDALRAELEQLKHRKPASGSVESSPSAAINENYVPLLRQREKQRKLKAIEKAYSAVMAAGEDLSAPSLEDVVKSKIGEPPAPPTVQPSFSQNAEVDAQLLDLKKALISTNRSIEERKKVLTSLQRNATVTTSPQAHIAGLQAALQELTGWMETQLTIIADSESNTQPSTLNEDDKPTPKSTLPTAANIEALYQQYLEARHRLTQTIKTPPPKTSDPLLEDLLTPSPTSHDPKAAAKSSAEIVLPYIPSLLASKQHEQSLLQQSAYMRQRVSSTETETENIIRRLAGESHIVQPGASRGRDWADAAEAAGGAMEKIVRERVRAGQVSVESARVALEGIRGLAGSVDGV